VNSSTVDDKPAQRPVDEPAAPFDGLELIDKRTLADLLQINPWTIDRWRKSRPDFPPCIWISGSTPRWSRAAVMAWLASLQKGGAAPDWVKSRTKPTKAAEPSRRRLHRA